MNNERTTPNDTKVESPMRASEAEAISDERKDERSSVASFPIVGVGASAGGLEAFIQLLKALPLDTGMGFVLVQHLDPEHESALAQILSRATSLPVCDVTNNQPVQPNQVYIIPPDTNLSISEGVLKLKPRSKTRTPHRPIDAFFESLALDHGERAIGVVLSGTASDGTLGLEAIKVAGGITFAQDESAKYDSMPRSAVAAGCVDLVLSPTGIAQELALIAKHPYVIGKSLELSTLQPTDLEVVAAHHDDDLPLPSGEDASPHLSVDSVRVESGSEDEPTGSDDGYAKTLSLLRSHSGVDFSLYKSSTIKRRIARRVLISQQHTLEGYANFLRGNVKELDALCSDVLISVTSFFRNPEAFEALQREVLPTLLKQPGEDPIRVWVPGCSTGQEAYSIAIAFMESAEKAPRGRNLQVFATDLNEKLLTKARIGLYPKSVADEIGPERLRRFFIEEQSGYRVTRSLREMVVFAKQNLFADPPFSRMDLISCRNLLIYLGPSLQNKAIATFHFALKPAGNLFLGASESVARFTELFETKDKQHKIYSKKVAPTPAFQTPANREPERRLSMGRQASALPVGQPLPSDGLHGELSAQREADRITVNQFAPPGVLVSADMQVLQFRGSTSAFLEPPMGKATFNLLKMAREGLMLPLRAAFNEAKKENKNSRRDNVCIMQNGTARAVNFEIIPLRNLCEPCFLILFEDTSASQNASSPRQKNDSTELLGLNTQTHQTPMLGIGDDKRIHDLEEELSETREYLHVIQEQHETANEELQAANEEVQSANEELQSINEELETSKEELESSNEELSTVNEEMTHRNAELNVLNNDLINFQDSTKLVALLLGRDLTIRRFSPQAEKQFDLRASDVGRPISHIRHSLVYADDTKTPLDLESLCNEVINTVTEKEREVLDKKGHWYSLRARPYTTFDHNVDGAVLLLLEVDQIKQSEQDAAAARDYASNIVENIREPLLVLDKDLRVESANRSFYRAFQVEPEETIGTFIYELGNHQWDIPRLRELLEEILPKSTSIEEFEVEHDFKKLGRRTMLLNARTILNPLQKTERILLAIEDITERKQLELAALANTARFESLFNSSPVGMYLVDADFCIRLVNPIARPVFGDIGDLTGQDFGEVMHILWQPTYADEIVQRFRHTLESGEPFQSLNRVEQRLDSGAIEYYEWQIHRLALPDGQFGVVCYFSDISERVLVEQRLQASETLYRRLFETAKDGVLILDANNGRILEANPYMTELSGYSTAEFIGKELWEIGLFGDQAANESVFRELQRQGYVRYDHLPLRSKSSQPIDVEFVSNVYQWDHRRVAQCNIRDISERSRMEKQMQAQAFELSELHRRKDEFLAMLSHELRNPLAPIVNAVHLLRLQDSEDKLQFEARNIIERQVSQMTRLIDDLMEVSRISTGRIHLHQERIALSGIVDNAEETVRPLIEQRQQSIVRTLPAHPIWLYADASRLEQVVVNLLTNASKYMDKSGTISIIVEQVENEAVLRVKDTGVGIAPDLLPHVFDLFTQSQRSLDRSQGGLGIGLALVKRLVEMHSGRVEAHSVLGKGSEFVVRLPILATPEPLAPLQEAAATGGRALRILVVDDMRDTRQILSTLLKKSGHEVLTAADGIAGLSAALEFRPHVALLDIGLPGMDGYELAKRIRQEPTLAHVVLVAMTGYGRESDRQQSREAGFNHHLVKPANFTQILPILATVSAEVI